MYIVCVCLVNYLFTGLHISTNLHSKLNVFFSISNCQFKSIFAVANVDFNQWYGTVCPKIMICSSVDNFLNNAKSLMEDM